MTWSERLGLELGGRSFGVRSDAPVEAGFWKRALPGATGCAYQTSFRRLSLVTSDGPVAKGLYIDSRDFELAHAFERLDEGTLQGLETKFQFALALLACPDLFFIHAGAVSFGPEAVLIVGRTRAGKTTLTRTLVEQGAGYLTDDCAIVDPSGNVLPNPAPLAVREGDERRYYSAESLGGSSATGPATVGTIMLANYEPGARWRPARVAQGEAAFRILGNLFYPAAVREHPRETMEFVSRLASRAEVFEGARGEAAEVAGWLLALRGRR